VVYRPEHQVELLTRQPLDPRSAGRGRLLDRCDPLVLADALGEQ
jgi:hypothetical protein